MTTPDPARVAAARRWYRALGHAPVVEADVMSVATPAHPDTWDMNWIQAGADSDAAAMFAALARHHPSGWQVVVVDALTPPAIEAALALAGFDNAVTVLEMQAEAIAGRTDSPPLEIQAVDDAGWDRFAALVAVDHREGGRTGLVDEAVAAGLLDAMRRRQGPCTHWLLIADRVDVGYGMTACCPNGLGLIENLFTLPERRRRGLMSAFIARAAAMLRAEGCDALFLDAHVNDTPKHLYARLGFVPVGVTRTWVRQLP